MYMLEFVRPWIRGWLAARRGQTLLIIKRQGMAFCLVALFTVSFQRIRPDSRLAGDEREREREGLVPRRWKRMLPSRSRGEEDYQGWHEAHWPESCTAHLQAGWTLKIQPRIKERGGGSTLPIAVPSLVCRPFFSPAPYFPCRPTAHEHPSAGGPESTHPHHRARATRWKQCSRYIETGLAKSARWQSEACSGNRVQTGNKASSATKAQAGGSAW